MEGYIENSLEISTFIYIFPAVLIVYLLILRKILISWYDPLFVYVFFNSFSISLVIYLYYVDRSITFFYLITFIISTIAFILGLLIAHRPIKFTPSLARRFQQNIQNYRNYSSILTISLWLSTLILLFANIFLFMVRGNVPILSENPSEAKVQLFTEGFGLIKRINFVFIPTSFAIALMKLFNPIRQPIMKEKYRLYGVLGAIFLVTLAQGSKGSLVIILTVMSYLLFISTIINNLTLAEKIKKYAIYLFILAVGYMVLVISLSNGSEDVIIPLTTRFVAAGDVFYFFYTYDLLSSFDLNLFDFLYRAFNPLLAMFRIVDYEYSFGELILYHSVGIFPQGFGPNTQHHIEGLLFFGQYFFWLHSFITGVIISLVRTRFLLFIIKRFNQLWLVIYLLLATHIVTIAWESALFASTFYDILLMFTPLLLLSAIVHHAVAGHQFVRRQTIAQQKL